MGFADFALVETVARARPAHVVLAPRLTDDLLVNPSVPVINPAPNWLRPASSGLVGVTAVCTDRTRPLLWRHGGHLELSSGNRTGGAASLPPRRRTPSSTGGC